MKFASKKRLLYRAHSSVSLVSPFFPSLDSSFDFPRCDRATHATLSFLAVRRSLQPGVRAFQRGRSSQLVAGSTV